MIAHHAVLVSSASPLTFDPEQSLHCVTSEVFAVQKFTIAHARQLIADAHRRPPGDSDEQVLCVATEFIIEEAQHALLKLIEEPPASTRFIFVIPTGYQLLPTLESRFQRIVVSEVARDLSVFNAFKAASYAERLKEIESAIKNKNTTWQADIKYGLHQYLTAGAGTFSASELIDFEYVLRLLLTRGASNKFLLELLALTLKPRS